MWLITVVPVFVLSIGMFGGSVTAGLVNLVEGAAGGEPIAVTMAALTLPLLGLPWLFWRLVNDR